MAYSFQIRPADSDNGYELSCDGVLPKSVHCDQLLHALMEAAKRGRNLNGTIQIFDGRGKLMDVVPLDSQKTLNRAMRACRL
ncbi:hypothetical protein ACXR0O_17215 [Verrucomicrobiota bacterium sgz303538]